MNYLIVNKETNVIENIIVWDGESEYNPGDHYLIVPANDQAVGDVYQA